MINHLDVFQVEVVADFGFYGLFIVMVKRLKFLNSLVADIVLLFCSMINVRERTKIRNRYNQVNHLNGFLVEMVADFVFMNYSL